MGRIEEILARHRAEGRGALISFLTVGYPDLPATEEALRGMEGAGASIVELGFPFSDPIADGPVIAGSMHEALANGVRPADAFALVQRVRDETSVGIVAMVSNSIVERIGTESFIEQSAACGFDGLIIPDLDLERADALLPLIDGHGMSFSLLVAPTTTDERLDAILPRCRGFVYLLARSGLTGERSDVPDIEPQVQRIRARTDLPIAVGFGISTPEHVAAMTDSADAAIVGSAIVRRMAGQDAPARAAIDYVASLASGLHAGT